MPKRTNPEEEHKPSQKPSRPSTEPDDIDNVNERSNWTPENADNFHWVLSKHTRFENKALHLDHRYLDSRDIRLVESMEHQPDTEDEKIIQHLELLNSTNPNKDCRRWFVLLRELQRAAGNKHSVKQINTKHINTRSRWSVPFKSLHEVGYLIKNQALRGAKRVEALQPIKRTNIEKKNLAAIKALRKYIIYRYFYWDEKAGRVPDTVALAKLPPMASDMEDNSEPERWIRAMIRRHGKQMVEYIDVCALNLATVYRQELMDRGEKVDLGPMSLAQPELVKAYLNKMVNEVMRLSKSPPFKIPGALKSEPKERLPPNAVSFAIDPLANASSFSSIDTSNVGDFANDPDSAKSDSDALQIASTLYRYEDKRNAEASEFEDRKAFQVKRSKSRSQIQNGAELPQTKQTPQPTNTSLLNLTPYGSMSAIKNLFPSDTHDEYFNQFINYDMDPDALMMRKEEPEPGTSSELLDAIINLSMNSSSNNSINIAQINESRLYTHTQEMPMEPQHTHPMPIYLGHPPFSQSVLNSAADDSSKAISPTMSGSNGSQHNLMASKPENSSQAELQGLLGSHNAHFTFKIPSNLQPDSRLGNLPASHSQSALNQNNAVPQMLHQSFSFSHMPNSTVQHYNGLQHPRPTVEPLSGASTSKLSTTLFYINGEPSYIELYHDNVDIQPNPIVLPISRIVGEKKYG